MSKIHHTLCKRFDRGLRVFLYYVKGLQTSSTLRALDRTEKVRRKCNDRMNGEPSMPRRVPAISRIVPGLFLRPYGLSTLWRSALKNLPAAKRVRFFFLPLIFLAPLCGCTIPASSAYPASGYYYPAPPSSGICGVYPYGSPDYTTCMSVNYPNVTQSYIPTQSQPPSAPAPAPDAAPSAPLSPPTFPSVTPMQPAPIDVPANVKCQSSSSQSSDQNADSTSIDSSTSCHSN
jgi:hypothetical protein